MVGTMRRGLILALCGVALTTLMAGCQIAMPPVAPGKEPEPVKPSTPSAQEGAARWKREPGIDLGTLAPESLAAWRAGCRKLASQAGWSGLCAGADVAGNAAWWMQQFDVYRVEAADGSGPQGMLTGYYEPLLNGGRVKSTSNAWPVFGVPADLLSVDLGGLYPALKGARVRGRLDGRRVVPYYTRGEIEAGAMPASTPVLAWVDDPVDLFFLQVQGSGRVRLEDGSLLRLGYADQNGHPYQSIGRELVKRGELTLDQASMQGIKAWAKRNPERLAEILNTNPSYVFFRALPASDDGPQGSLGVPLTPGYSIAVDTRSIPLGTPVVIETTLPGDSAPTRRLVMAQDTGGAIKGGVRADLFTGFGPAAGELAGKMRQPLRYWVLWPKGLPLPAGVKGEAP